MPNYEVSVLGRKYKVKADTKSQAKRKGVHRYKSDTGSLVPTDTLVRIARVKSKGR